VTADADPDGRDPAFAAERTDLAWARSGLSLLGCGALVLRGFGRPPLTTGNVAIGVFLLLLGTIASFLGGWHARRVRRAHGRRTTTRDLAPIALGVAGIGVAAFVVAAVKG
jgi:uncharacterized membrane protein YidH (DUF202 family)